MRKQLLFLLFGLPLLGIAQVHQTPNCYNQFVSGQHTFVFADTAYIQELPIYSTRYKDKLHAGTEVTIVRRTDSLFETNRIVAHWYEIQYKAQKGIEKGYIWGKDLSFNKLKKGDIKFVFGIHNITDDPYKKKHSDPFRDNIDQVYEAVIKTIRKEAIIDRTYFNIDHLESAQSAGASIIHSNKGLNKVLSIIQVGFSGAACMVPSYIFTFAWNGSQLQYLPTTLEIGDEGYYYMEKLVFPSDDGGKPDSIIKQIREGESNDKTDHERLTKTEVYSWNGSRAVLVQRKAKSNKRIK